MVLIGGVDPRNSTMFVGLSKDGDESKDPWAQGIGVFDLNVLKFKDSYQAQTEPYELPDLMKDYFKAKPSVEYLTMFDDRLLI